MLSRPLGAEGDALTQLVWPARGSPTGSPVAASRRAGPGRVAVD